MFLLLFSTSILRITTVDAVTITTIIAISTIQKRVAVEELKFSYRNRGI